MYDFLEFIDLITTKENLTLITALIGAIGAVHVYVQQRKKISIQLLEIHNTDAGFFIHCLFSNKSYLPISITDVKISENRQNMKVACFVTPKKIAISDKRSTAQFPLSLSSLEAYTYWVGFPIPEKNALISPTHLTFQFLTTRGKIKIKSLPLSEVPQSRNRTL